MGSEGKGGSRSLGLYLRTARHLRWEQWLFRPVRRIQARLPAGSAPPGEPDRAAAVPLAAEVAAWGVDPARGVLEEAERVCAGTFTFLGEERHLARIPWQERVVSHLWSYNLHYFDFGLDLARAYRETGEEGYARRFEWLALSWIDSTEPGRGDGWEPYPISLRAVNWMYALLLLGDAVRPTARERIEGSLLLQLGFLERRQERHILANHLQKNLKALAIGGLFFRGEAGERWSDRPTRRLWAETLEQVLPDGGHFERSPMYHAIALGDLLEVVALHRCVGREVPAPVLARLDAMIAALGVLSRGDGSLHLFNDSADGIAPSRAWLDAMARHVRGRPVPDPAGELRLDQAGFFGWCDPVAGERLLVDVGEPGPAYQPGHAHCGMLGFEVDFAGRAVVVDSGVSGYADDALREYVRSTRAHSTVRIGGREQAEVWGSFRMAGRPRLVERERSIGPSGYRLVAACSPHGTTAIHRRTFHREPAGWRIEDRVEGGTGETIDSFLHLHPDFHGERQGNAWVFSDGSTTVEVIPRGYDAAVLVVGESDPPQGWHCPRFGTALPAPTLHFRIEHNRGGLHGYTIRHRPQRA